VEIFVPIKIHLNSMVGWNYSSDYEASVRGRNVSIALSGVDAALPDTYGMTTHCRKWRLDDANLLLYRAKI